MNVIVNKNKNTSNNTIKHNSQCYSSSTNTKKKTVLEMDTVADSAATGHFFPNEDNAENDHNEIKVVCANNQTMISKATTVLNIPELSTKAKTAYKFNSFPAIRVLARIFYAYFLLVK
jgi:hypothetical protein